MLSICCACCGTFECFVDTLVKDYLLFRGFTKSFNEFNREREQDRVQKFNVEKIVQQIRAFVVRFVLGVKYVHMVMQ